MENMFWGGEVLKLESVALPETKVQEWRETLRKAVLASLIPLKAYAEGTARSLFRSVSVILLLSSL